MYGSNTLLLSRVIDYQVQSPAEKGLAVTIIRSKFDEFIEKIFFSRLLLSRKQN